MIRNIFDIPRELKNNGNFPFWYSLLIESEFVVDYKNVRNVIDFGSGNGGFANLVSHFHKSIEIECIEINSELLINCKKRNLVSNIRYGNYIDMKNMKRDFFDIIFSQEVVYTISDLEKHANEMFSLLAKGGSYIFTIGCHLGNPTWPYRKKRINKEESYSSNDYSLEYIANVFHESGFRVSVKRLPIYSPLVYDPSDSSEFSSIEDLLLSSEEQKIVFFLLKPKHQD